MQVFSFYLSHVLLLMVMGIAYSDFPLLMPVPILFANFTSTWDLFHKPKTRNNTPSSNFMYRLVLYTYTILHHCTLAYLIYYSLTTKLNLLEVVVIIIFAGFVLGAFGMNAAHELMHGNYFDRILSFSILFSANYPHLFYQHLRIHHRWAATENDNGTALLGESLYSFLPRVIIGGYILSWKTESFRLRKRAWYLSFLCNKVQIVSSMAVLINIAIFLLVGLASYLMFLGLSIVSILCYEITTYVQHYGLMREKDEKGNYVSFQSHHAWNFSGLISDGYLLNLQRHSDHHANPNKAYQYLENDESLPQLPYFHTLMFTMSLIPPLWFRVMNPLVLKARLTA